MTTTQLPPPPTGTEGAVEAQQNQPEQPQGSFASMLPQTGSQMQMQTLNAQMLPPAPAAPTQGGQSVPTMPTSQGGTTSLSNLASTLAQSYGLPIGRGGLVDERGNFLMTPEQVAAASGGQETMGSAAAKMNYVAQAVTRQQNISQQQKGIAALQTGLGLVQSRGRGSAAAMQSGFYEGLADMYSNQEYDAADFSYFIQKEQLDQQERIARDQRKAAEKSSKYGGIGSAIGGIVGSLTGIPGLSQAGAALGGYAGAEWF